MLFLCGKYNKDTCGYSSLVPFTFNILTLAAAERSREKINECVRPRRLALTSGVIRYSNEARCFGTSCCLVLEAIAACSTTGRGSNRDKIDLFLYS